MGIVVELNFMRKPRVLKAFITCVRCKETKPRAEFPARIDFPRAVQTTCTHCRENHRPYGPQKLAEKRCKSCDTIKPRSEFYELRNRITGKVSIRPECRPCTVKQRHGWKQLARAEGRKINALVHIGSHIKNFTRDDYWAMHQDQGGLCYICHQPPIGKWRLSIDHDHATDEVRGLLCDQCNCGLGNFKDSPELLLAAIEYLRRFSSESVVA